MADGDADYTPIDCNLYDYVEIACLYRYPVRVATADGESITGIAVDTVVDGAKGEYLVLDVEDSRQRVRLDTLTVLEALVDNARFDKLRFRD